MKTDSKSPATGPAPHASRGPQRTWIGAGVSWRQRYARQLRTAPAPPAVLEVIPEHFFADPEALAPWAASFPLVFHAVGLSVATAGCGPARDVLDARLHRVRELVRIGRPVLVSDHLAITVAPDGADIGHLAPIPYTDELLRLVADRVRIWQDTLQVPIALENIATPFAVPGASMTEAEFLHRLVEATNCHLLLDVSNLLFNSRNHGGDPHQAMCAYPLHAVAQVHLAGGFQADGWWVDSHSEPVENASYALLAALRGRAPVRTIIVERDERWPPLADLLAEAMRAAALWEASEEESL